MAVTLTLKGFRAWLESKADDEPVGIAFEQTSCPLATYLLSTGAVAPAVGVMRFTLNVDKRPILHGGGTRLPMWARRFVRAVDLPGRGVITAAVAMAKIDYAAKRGF